MWTNVSQGQLIMLVSFRQQQMEKQRWKTRWNRMMDLETNPPRLHDDTDITANMMMGCNYYVWESLIVMQPDKKKTTLGFAQEDDVKLQWER